MVSLITRARLTLKLASSYISRKASKVSKFFKKCFESCFPSKKKGERAPLLPQHAETEPSPKLDERGHSHLGQHWLLAQHAEDSDGGYTPRPLSPINSNASAVPSSRTLTPVAPNQAVSYNFAEHRIGIVKDDIISSWLRSINLDSEVPVYSTSTATSWGNTTSHMGAGFDGPTSPLGETDDFKPSTTTDKSFPWSRADDPGHPRSKHIKSTTYDHVHKNIIDLLSLDLAVKGDHDDDEDAEKCHQVTQHHAQFHNFKSFALKSCPELHKPPLDCFEDLESKGLRNDTHDNSTSKPANKTRPSVRQAMSRGLRSLGRRFRQSSSSYSIRSGFPVPPEGKERRLLARESADIHPSSGSETPLFNTPETGGTPTATSRGNVDLLAMGGTMIAASELDRLSSSGTIHSGPPSTAGTTLDPQYDDVYSSLPSLRREQKRRAAARSRLSEVTTPEDLANPNSSPPETDILDEPAKSELSRLIPQPLKLGRDSIAEQNLAAPISTKSAPAFHMIKSLGLDEGLASGQPNVMTQCSNLVDAISLHEKGAESARPRICKTISSNAPVIFSEPPLVTSTPIRTEQGGAITGSVSANESHAGKTVAEGQCSRSCHPDTWSETGGEPGDSDPFCPPECDSRHSLKTVVPPQRPPGLVRQTTSGTVLVMEPVDSSRSETDQSAGDESS
ncbi:hypothetical protein PG985_006402 [Apiospora marii]|uniref:Uncharacterized protein n=1 Tax=Apiospora marii TaxID=335849 RepID=A0ABR1S9C1_9PEZI